MRRAATRRSAELLFPVFQGPCLAAYIRRSPTFVPQGPLQRVYSRTVLETITLYAYMLRAVRHTCYSMDVFGAQLRAVWLCVSPLPSLPCSMQSAHCTVNNASRLNLPTNEVLLRLRGLSCMSRSLYGCFIPFRSCGLSSSTCSLSYTSQALFYS